jgi:hypothetical protein
LVLKHLLPMPFVVHVEPPTLLTSRMVGRLVYSSDRKKARTIGDRYCSSMELSS